MIGRRHGWSAAAGAALFTVAGMGGGEAAVTKTFSLVITGAEGARYTGRCTLTTAAGEETFELTGVVPRYEELRARGSPAGSRARG